MVVLQAVKRFESNRRVQQVFAPFHLIFGKPPVASAPLGTYVPARRYCGAFAEKE